MSIAALGYIILIAVDARKSPGACYFAVFLAVTGVAPCISGTITWCGNNIGPTLKRATGMVSLSACDESTESLAALMSGRSARLRHGQGHFADHLSL